MNKLYVVFFFFCIVVNAQDATEYNKVYTKTYLEISQKDFGKALHIADSLFTISESPYFQAKSLMLTASLYQYSGDLKKSVEYALRSEKILEKTDNDAWKTRVCGFLATQYRILKLYGESQKYTEKTLKINKKIKDPESANVTTGLMCQEMAYYEMQKKNYKKAIDRLHKSQQYFNLIKSDKAYFTAVNEQLLGFNYLRIKEYDNAIAHYQKGLKYAKGIPENQLSGLIHNGFAEVYIEKKDQKEAKKHLDIAQRISEESQFLSLKEEVNETAQKYYALVQDVEKIVETKIKQDAVLEEISEKKSAFIDESYAKLNEKNERTEKTGSNKNIIIVVIGLIMLLGVIYFAYYSRKQKKSIEKFKQLMKDLEDKNHRKQESTFVISKVHHLQNVSSIAVKVIENPLKDDDGSMMTAETERKILENLDKFENSDLFTDNNISLSYLATYCETNPKYLSHLINSYRKKDFNNYINELRVNYIIEKLKNIPKYRKYKIAVLAEEAGFSSQNKFATIFKKETSISPSLFIKYLTEEIAELV